MATLLPLLTALFIRKCALALLIMLLSSATLLAASSGLNKLLRKIPATALQTARSPYVWAPSAGAAIIFASGTDRAISDWASSTNPIYGSRHRASAFSDQLRETARVTFITTSIIDLLYRFNQGNYSVSLVDVLSDCASIGLSQGITDASKSTTDRLRPDGSNSRSFPSGHTSITATYTMLSSTSLNLQPMSPLPRKSLQAGLTTMTALTGWARIEGQHHYPTDVLVGAAVGNFVALFITNLLNEESSEPLARASLAPTIARGVQFNLTFSL
jgi:hypothetical protein